MVVSWGRSCVRGGAGGCTSNSGVPRTCSLPRQGVDLWPPNDLRYFRDVLAYLEQTSFARKSVAERLGVTSIKTQQFLILDFIFHRGLLLESGARGRMASRSSS